MTVFIAVITHKAVMAFSLGLNIAQSDLSVKAFVWSNVLLGHSGEYGNAAKFVGEMSKSVMQLISFHF